MFAIAALFAIMMGFGILYMDDERAVLYGMFGWFILALMMVLCGLEAM